MTKESQRRAVDNQRKRMRQRGFERYEVIGPAGDKELVRGIVKTLAAGGPQAERLREQAKRTIAPKGKTGADLYNALRQGPLFPDDFDISREFTTGRDVDL
ncbi:MAG: hypothetical protein ACREHE_16825 [Rhizomicrobium sp.]